MYGTWKEANITFLKQQQTPYFLAKVSSCILIFINKKLYNKTPFFYKKKSTTINP